MSRAVVVAVDVEKKHTKLNRYSEWAFDAPVRDPRIRAFLNAAARKRIDAVRFEAVLVHLLRSSAAHAE